MVIDSKKGVPGFVTRIRQGKMAKEAQIKGLAVFKHGVRKGMREDFDLESVMREAQLAFMQAPILPEWAEVQIKRANIINDAEKLAIPVHKVIETFEPKRMPTWLLIQELQARKEVEGLNVVFQPKAKVSIFANREKYADRLIKMGWRRLGGGYYSDVFEHPKSDKAIKVCKERDEAHQDQCPLFAAWAQTIKSPHLIKVYNIKRHKGFYVAIMEKLDSIHNNAELNRHLPYKKQVDITSEAMMEYKYHVRSIQPEDNIHAVAENAKIRYIRKHIPKLLPTLKLLQKAQMIDDCHSGNYGYRADGTPVIFDPVTFIGNMKLLNRLKSNEQAYGLRSLTRKAA